MTTSRTPIPGPSPLPAAARCSPAGSAVGLLGRVPRRNSADSGPGRASTGPTPPRRAPCTPKGGITYVEYGLREECRPAGGLGGQHGGRCPCSRRPTTSRSALTGAILYSDLTQNLGGGVHQPQPERIPDLRLQLLHLPSACPSAGGGPELLVRQLRERDDGHGARSRTGAVHRVRGLSRAVQDGEARLLADSPNLVQDDFQAAGRLPGGTTPPPRRPRIARTPTSPEHFNRSDSLQLSDPRILVSDVGTNTNAPTAAGQGPNTASSHAGGGLASTQNVSGPGSSAAAAVGGTNTVAKQKAQNELTDPRLAYDRQDALDAAATTGLLGWSSTEVALWCAVFAAVLSGVPLSVWFWQRRRRADEEGTT